MSDSVKTLTEFDFKKTIKDSKKPIIIEFFAKWCSPCKMQAPILEEIHKELSNKLCIYKIDIDSAESLAQNLGIEQIPTILVFKDGEEVERAIGLMSKSEIAAMLIKHL